MRDVLVEFKALRLHRVAGARCDLQEQGPASGLDASRWLVEHLLQAETTDRAMRSVQYQMASARFPVHRDLAGFDFDASVVDQKLIQQLAALEFTEAAHNAVLVGGPRTGKTHLATALGVSGITRQRKRVRFYSTVDLVNALEQEKAQREAGRIASVLLRMDLVILDELGYLPFSQAGGALLFHLLSQLYERTSVVITTNRDFADSAINLFFRCRAQSCAMPSSSKSTSSKNQAVPGRRRLAPEQREQQIVAKAIEHFTRYGFAGSTRELAREIGVTQPLLYKYFPNKEALIDRVYSEVFSWQSSWETDLTDRTVALAERLYRFYIDYAQVILREEWIRIFIFAGLTREGINNKYLSRLRTRVFLPVLVEVRHEYDIPEPRTAAELESEIELVWALHASIFYLGVRKWIYGLKIPKDIDALIRTKVNVFLHGAPQEMSELRRPSATG